MGCSSKEEPTTLFPEKKFVVKIIIATDTTLTYKCDKVYISGYAEDCEDNMAEKLDILLFDSYITEIINREKEL
jgi:hypothetical protein